MQVYKESLSPTANPAQANKEIHVRTENNTVVISTNKEGLLSLAEQLTMLAEMEPGSHIHYDENNSLEDGSAEMIIEAVGS